MKIGIICHSSCGGSARIAIEEAVELARRGHRVHLFSRNPPFLAPEYSLGVMAHTLFHEFSDHHYALNVDWPQSEMDSMTTILMKVILEDGMDILHIHYGLPFAFIAAEIKRRLDKDSPALVLTLHGSDVTMHERKSSLGRVLAQTLKNFNILTTVSLSHARLASKVLKVKTIQVIPNFVDPDVFACKDRSLRLEKHRILHISNFRPVKNVSGVVHIFAAIREKIEAELWFVGDGEETVKAERVSERYGLKENIHFLGMRKEVASILEECDLLIMPSESESFCLTALEAMASGMPVIASRVGGLPEVVKHGETGYLFSKGRYATAARYAVQILSNPHLYKSMSSAARERAFLFDKNRVVSIYEKLYNQILQTSLSS